MGKIRVATLGDKQSENEQKRRADARRQTKASKKQKVEGVGLHGGQRVSVVEGTDLKPEFKKLIAEVESGASVDVGKKAKKEKAVKAHVRSKKYQEIVKLIDRTKLYNLKDAVSLVKQTSMTKFDGTVELHMNLNVAVLGNKKDYRTTLTLPHGSGKQLKVAIADDAILAEVESGKITFDILVAHPSMMPKLAKVARILGPKGLMPNPRIGTVTDDPAKKVKELEGGQMNIKTEPDQPIMHLPVGKVSFTDKQIVENIEVVLRTVGNKVNRATITSTMGPGVKISLS